MIKLYYDKTNVNLVNISGQIAINLFFDNGYELNNLNEFYFDKILEMSTINIQNNQGKTTWHYLADNDVWENYYDILITKRNKIFIQDLDGITPYTSIKTNYSNKMSKFIDLIANSFYNNVKLMEGKIKSNQNQKDELDFIFKFNRTN